MVFFDDDGKPLTGKKFTSGDLQSTLGWTPKQLYRAVKRLRRKGVPLITVREAIAEGEYCLPKTKEEMETAAERRRKELVGGGNTLNDVLNELAEQYPSLHKRKIHTATHEFILTRFGTQGLAAFEEALYGEEADQRALPAASA
jgi:biotin operon repressor